MTRPRDYGSIKHRRLKEHKDDSFIDEQFHDKPPRIPWKAIVFAIILFVLGTGLLITSLLIVGGFLEDVRYEDRPISLAILGFLMFLPGAYHVRIAYYAMKGHPAYSFDDIPEFQ